MKATDLMIGDWVEVIQNSEKHFAQVQIIDGYGDNATSNECICDAIYYSIDELNPIPLTAEILEKNGFKRWKNDNPCLIYEFKQSEECISVCVYFPKGYNTRYYKNWASVSTNENYILHCVCEYVHELQHALRLCGIEKEIKL